jgi:hypothetical protein
MSVWSPHNEWTTDTPTVSEIVHVKTIRISHSLTAIIRLNAQLLTEYRTIGLYLVLPRCPTPSRASAAALNTVLRTTTHAFLWKHAIFRHLPSRNPSTDQDELLHDWLRRWDYVMYQQWLQWVGWRRPHRYVQYNLKNFSYYTWLYVLLYLTLPYLFSYKPPKQKRLNQFLRTMAQTTRLL